MEEKEFVALVDELEGYARQNPGAYKLRVTLLTALGYIFLIGSVVIVLLLALTGLALLYFGRLSWLIINQYPDLATAYLVEGGPIFSAGAGLRVGIYVQTGVVHRVKKLSQGSVS